MKEQIHIRDRSFRWSGYRTNFELFGYLSLLIILILLPALWNGYPLVYSDTGTYIDSGYFFRMPVDRPLGYGLFLRYGSFGWHSLWIPIVLQALLIAIMMIRSWKAFTLNYDRPALIILTLVLSIGTAVGWHGGRLQPDIFTSLAILAVLLHYFTDQGKWASAMDFGIIILACITHLSNIPILIALLIMLLPHALFVAKSWRMKAIRRLLAGSAAIAISVLLLITINFKSSGKAIVGEGGHVFLIGRLLDTGLLRPWLEKDCLTRDHFLCTRKADIPSTSKQLLWWDDSPMNDSGGWSAVRKESDAMLARFFMDPENILAFAAAGVKDTGKQLLLWGLEHEIISHWYRDPSSPPSMALRVAVPHELPAYYNSLQNGGRGELRMKEINVFHYFILSSALLAAFAFFLLALKRAVAPAQVYMLAYIFLAVIIAAGTGAALSVPDQRFLAKVSWLLPFGVAMVWSNYFRSRRSVSIIAGDQGVHGRSSTSISATRCVNS